MSAHDRSGWAVFGIGDFRLFGVGPLPHRPRLSDAGGGDRLVRLRPDPFRPGARPRRPGGLPAGDALRADHRPRRRHLRPAPRRRRGLRPAERRRASACSPTRWPGVRRSGRSTRSSSWSARPGPSPTRPFRRCCRPWCRPAIQLGDRVERLALAERLGDGAGARRLPLRPRARRGVRRGRRELRAARAS